jgi:superfamily II DNA/RNA helicase
LNFSEIDLHPTLFAGIEKQGFTECTPIQELTIPPILEGKDIAGLAQTGTGKTAAFLLPLMERIVRARLNPDELSDEEKELREKRMFPEWRANQFVLVLVPTRELADQVYENSVRLSAESGLRSVCIYGGVAYEKQKEGLRQGVEFVIATPGRLIDLYKEHLVDLKQVRAIVFDEADRMFDMGFKDDMKFILTRVPKERQFLVFSATLNLDVLNTAYQFGANPVEVNVSRDQATAENVEDKIFHVGQHEKGAHLLSLIALHKPRQAIIFSNFKMNVPRISQFLNDNGFPTVGISSLLTQSQRTRVMEQFKGSSDHNILVATDVAARGLDIKGVDMVINYELPDDAENYVHRIGRTGRAGASGIAFSLVSDRDVDALTRVEQYLKRKVPQDYLEEGQLVKEYKAMPAADRGDRGPRRDEGRSGGGDRAPRGGGRSEARPEGRREGGSAKRSSRPERGPRAASTGGPRPMEAGQTSSGPRPVGDGPRPQQGGARGGRPNQQAKEHPEKQGKSQGGKSRHGGKAHAANGGAQRHGGAGTRNGGAAAKVGGGPRPSGPQPRGGKPHKPGSRPGGKPAPSVGGKVSGFFKRLFGG